MVANAPAITIPQTCVMSIGKLKRLLVLRDIEERLYEHCLQANFQLIILS